MFTVNVKCHLPCYHVWWGQSVDLRFKHMLLSTLFDGHCAGTLMLIGDVEERMLCNKR